MPSEKRANGTRPSDSTSAQGALKFDETGGEQRVQYASEQVELVHEGSCAR
jgi:hypothetical protein